MTTTASPDMAIVTCNQLDAFDILMLVHILELNCDIAELHEDIKDWRLASFLLSKALNVSTSNTIAGSYAAAEQKQLEHIILGLTAIMDAGIIADLNAVRTGKMPVGEVSRLWYSLVRIGSVDMNSVGLMPSEAALIFGLSPERLLSNSRLWAECDLPKQERQLLALDPEVVNFRQLVTMARQGYTSCAAQALQMIDSGAASKVVVGRARTSVSELTQLARRRSGANHTPWRHVV